MTQVLTELVLLFLCLAASFLYSGAEIGFYSLSRVRVELEAGQGGRAVRRVSRLLRDEPALLITLLIGNNVALELATLQGDRLFEGAGFEPWQHALLVTLVLSPVFFLLGEALPKDLYRRRPHAMTYPSSLLVWISRWAFWPLERLLRGISSGIARVLGLGSGRMPLVGERERLAAFLAEGRRLGALHERAEALALNALKLRTIPISRAMVPWGQVQVLHRGASNAELFERVRESRRTRLRVGDEEGRYEGYVHQLEVLAAGAESKVLGTLRALPVLSADTPVDRALSQLRAGGRRAAVVGTAEKPLGLVTLKDLVEEISGDLVGL